MKQGIIWLIGFVFVTAPDAAQAQFRYRTNNNSITITGYTGANGEVTIPDIIKACSDLASAVWIPISTNTMSSDSCYVSDPTWTNFSQRLYRIHSP